MKAYIEHIVKGNKFNFHSGKFVHHIESKSIILSDLHLGKAMHFRKNGIALPKNLGHDNLKRLNDILSFHRPKELLILGDLFHSEMNSEWEDFKALRYHFSKIKFILIEGNHDSFVFEEYQKANIEVLKEFDRNGILFTHEPKETELINCYGHIHPAIRLKGSALQSLRLPCFYVDKSQIILPSFGVFTGMHTIKPKRDAKVFALMKSGIFEAKHKEKTRL